MVERQLPKLNVAGSIPVSRSKKSETYEIQPDSVFHLCSIYMMSSFSSSLFTAGNRRLALGNHPNPAIGYHFKSGHSETA